MQKIYSLLLLGAENKNREKEGERESARDKDLVQDRPSDNFRMEYIIPVCKCVCISGLIFVMAKGEVTGAQYGVVSVVRQSYTGPQLELARKICRL